MAAFSAQGATFVANVVIANLLGQHGFGQYSIIQTTLLVAAGIAQVATGITATKYVAEFRERNKERAGRILGLCMVLTVITGGLAALLLLVFATQLAGGVLLAPTLSGELKIGATLVLFAVMNGYQIGALAGLEKYRTLAFLAMWHGVVHVATCATLAAAWGLSGAVFGLVVSATARWFLFARSLRREASTCGIRIRYRDLSQERSVLLGFALPAAVSGFSSMPSLWLANAFLVQQSDGFVQMGLYSAANNLKNLVMFLPALTNNVGVTLLNYQRGANDEVRYRKVFIANLIATAILLVLVAAVIGGLGKVLLGFFGSDFPEAYPILLVLLGSAIAEGLAIAIYQVVQSQEKMWYSLGAVVIPRDLILIVVAFIATKAYGGLGLAIAFLASAIVGLITTALVAYKIGLKARSEA